MRTLITTRGAVEDASRASIAHQLKAAEKGGFWLDITAPDEEDYQILQEVFDFHPLTIEDVRQQNQRPKLEEYPSYNFAVLFAPEREREHLQFREHHLYIAPHYLVSIHQEPAPVLDKLRERIIENPTLTRDNPAFLTYLVLDQLVDLLFSVLEEVDDKVDQLEDALITRARQNDLVRITRLRHQVTELRRCLGAQRDMFQRLLTHTVTLGDAEMMVYYRDVYDHLVRQYDEVDSLRDLLAGAMDIYLSTVSNRLGVTVKQLTVVACLFLPLTFLTGFFGMNFGFLVSTIATPTAFLVGLALMVISVLIQLYFFRRHGWI
jgi:magnesium transporter